LPLIVVFVTPALREQEYRRSDAHVQFLADELVPFMRDNFDATADAGQTGVLGSGLGGLAAVYTAVTRPDTFGLAAGLSGFYSLDDEALARVAGRQTAPLGRFYLAAGSYETAVPETTPPINVIQANQRLLQTLQPRAAAVQYEQRPQGHSWGHWRDAFGDALRFLYQE
jgi:enterochelin esterase-like enzyme